MAVMTRQELLDIIDQAEREGWEELDLQGKQIEELPSEIGRLTGLALLDLSHNQLTALPSEIGQMTNLQSLHCGYNQVTDLPPEVAGLTNLLWLDLSRNQLAIVPSEIVQLVNLLWLNLSHNQLTSVPSEIIRLTHLHELDLSNNELSSVPLEIGEFNNLQKLDLAFNQLMTVPTEISKLNCLQVLDLFGNPLKFRRQKAGRLCWAILDANGLLIIPSSVNLVEIDLSALELAAVPPEISQLTSLTSLNLGGNKLTAVPPEISRLTNLASLELGKNQLTFLPPEIGQLTSLTELNLGGNKLTVVPPEISQLTSLTSLDLRNNQLTTLPASLRQLSNLKELHLYDNPLPLSLELLDVWRNPDDPQTILNTYFVDNRPLREAKLLLVGEGSVGKTSLIERLLWNMPPSDSGKTVGVDIHNCLVESGQLKVDSEQLAVNSEAGGPIRLNVWDFGGQEIYHATHQFFLTYRSLYLVVIEARRDEEANRLDYWLRHIQSFAGDAPVILVINKIDQHQPTLDERGLMLRHPTIQAIIHTSCATGSGIDKLHQTIAEAVATLPHVNDEIPPTWFAIKEKLTERDEDYLPIENYVKLCEAEGIAHELDQRTLAGYLHDLGIALNFQDDHRLAGTHVLNPEWVTGGIYKIIDDDHLQGKGILHLNDLDRILDSRRYPYHKHPFLLDIMGKFELCVSLDDNNCYLIPGLLPKERPLFDWPTVSPEMANGAVALEYRYAILPPAVLSRLMVRLHDYTWQGGNGDPIRWRNGLILARDGCRALVVADPTPTAPRITIALEGPFPHRRHLLASIRAELRVIHRSFARLEAEEWVPLPGHSDKAIKYQTLLNAEARGKMTYYDGDSDMNLDITLLLDGVEPPAIRLAERMLRERGYTFNIHVGDKYDMSGDFRQSILNLGSTMERVTQTINNKPAVSSADRESLQLFIEQLLVQLTQTPSRAELQAEAVARQAERLLNLVASSSQPDPNLIEASSRQLEQAAETTANDMPALPAVVRQVVAFIGRVVKDR